jgi:hypothetical protein
MGLYVLAGVSALLLLWAIYYLQSGVRLADHVGEDLLGEAGMRTDSHMTAEGLGFTQPPSARCSWPWWPSSERSWGYSRAVAGVRSSSRWSERSVY